MYGTETLPITKGMNRRIYAAEMRMFRWMSGVTRKDRVRNTHIRRTTKVGNVFSNMQEGRLRWYGHVMRRPETYVGWRVMNMDPPGARGRGRPKKR